MALALPGVALANPCLDQTARQETAHDMPRFILSAVSLVESGRSIERRGTRQPWPWTMNVNGQGYYFESKAEAVAAVERLLQSGQKSIDVGCMQINLKHHPRAFASLEEAFDPAANVAYGARFLASLQREDGRWDSALGKYHSRTPSYAQLYLARLINVWQRMNAGGSLGVAMRLPKSSAPAYPDAGLNEQDPIKALQFYGQAVETAPASARALLGRAIALDHLAAEGMVPVHQARIAYAQMLAYAKGNREKNGDAAWLRLRGLVEKDSLPERISILEELFMISGGPAEFAAYIGEMHEKAGDLPKARNYMREAMLLSPKHEYYKRHYIDLSQKVAD